MSPRFFSVLGVPLVAGREFTDADRRGGEQVAIVSQSIAQRFFPNDDALNRHLWTADPNDKWRIVGIAADVDDENVVGQTAMTFYWPVHQAEMGGRLFVRASGDPHSLVSAVTRTIREIAPDQPARASRIDVIEALRSE